MRIEKFDASRCQPHAAALVAIIFLFFATQSSAGDWPQILGPHRNGQSVGETLANAWPKAGPKTLWSHEVGSGFAGPVVVGQRVIVFHRVGKNERIEALSTAGKKLWQTDFDASYRGTINPDDGPRCVPTVAGDAVYAYGAAGDLHCVELTTGKRRWSRAALVDYKGAEGYFGAGSSPLVIGDAVLVNVGGRDGAGIVAFATKTGKTLWTAGDEQASYSSPTTTKLDGKTYAVFVTRYNALKLDPANGKILATTPFGQRGPTVNAAMPLMIDGKLFLTASYGIGAQLLNINHGGLTEVWASDEAMSSQYNTPVYRDGYLYGIHGREDVGRAALRCIDAATGKVQWSEDEFGVAHLILAGDKLLIARIDGTLVLANASPKGFAELARHKAFAGTLRAIPALSDGNLYARDDVELKCVQVGE